MILLHQTLDDYVTLFQVYEHVIFCGKSERLKPSYSLTEAGQDARVSMPTGRPASQRSTVSASKTYSLLVAYVFQPKQFTELQNAQAIVLRTAG